MKKTLSIFVVLFLFTFCGMAQGYKNPIIPGLYRKFRKGWRKNAACWIMREAGYMMNIRISICFIICAARLKRV